MGTKAGRVKRLQISRAVHAVAAVLALAAALVAAEPARAVEAVNVRLDAPAIDLTAATERLKTDTDRIQVSTAPGPDGIVRRIEVRARESSTNWAVFALTNNSDEQIDRLIVVPHYRMVGSGLIWPDLGLSRLSAITLANGFSTDAGKLVLLGEAPTLGEDDPDSAIAIVIGEDEPGHQGENVVYVLPIEVQALVKANVTEPLLAAESVVGDIKRALELDHDIGGLAVRRGFDRGPTRVLPREEGSGTVGVGVGYRILIAEKWGDP